MPERVPVVVIFKSLNYMGNRIHSPVSGMLDGSLIHGNFVEIANNGLLTSYPWRDIERIQIVRPEEI